MDKKITISMTLKQKHIDYLDEKSKDMGMSRSAFVALIISQHMQSQDLVKILPDLVNVLSDLDKQLKEKEKEV